VIVNLTLNVAHVYYLTIVVLVQYYVLLCFICGGLAIFLGPDSWNQS